MSIFKKLSFAPYLLRRWYWVLALGLLLLVWSALALAMLPLKDDKGAYTKYPYGLIGSYEQDGLDVLFQLRDVMHPELRERGLKEPITLIEVDEDSIRESHIRLQKWPRSYYARLIDRATAGGASVIGLDVYLSEAGGLSELDKADDQKILESITNANIILVKKLPLGGSAAIDPLPEFAEQASATGFADLPHDSDGFIRTGQLFNPRQKDDFSFGAALAQIHTQQPLQPIGGEQVQYDAVSFGPRIVPLRPDAQFNIDFRSRSPGFRRISAREILFREQDNISDEEYFRDRIILIGATNNDAPDLFETPYYQPGLIATTIAKIRGTNLETAPRKMPGIEVHANVVASLLFGKYLRRLSYRANIFILFLVISLTSLAVLWLRPLWGTLLVVSVAVGTLAAATWFFYHKGIILPLAATEGGVLIVSLSGFLLRYAHEKAVRDATEAERAAIMDIFSKCVSPEVADTLWQQRGDLSIAGERRIVTLIFTDIRGFTTLSESVDSAVVVEWLNEYFSRMHRIVTSYGGHINKFIGDGLMIVFGAPIDRGQKLEARAAVACGLEMLAEVERMNLEWKDKDRPQIAIGVGVHTGEATCGVVGAEGRLEYTIIGDTVNLSARLESTTKEKGVPILISDSTAALLGIDYDTQPLGDVKVKGKNQSTEVFTVKKNTRKPTPATAKKAEPQATV
ncbi:MAG TPA: CHASE2 domain-containing protein [Pyrinomonadaceae bacterium]|jgi:adenylate cyclase